MVSQGPPLIHRLARALAPLNWLLAPVALWGAVALAAGRGAAPSERDGGRLVALFLALQLVTMLLAGGNWNTRYSAPMVAPGALAAAAGLQRLASLLSGGRRLERPYGLAMAGVGLALICALVLWDRPLRSGQEIASRGRSQLTLVEQIEAIRVLGERGFGAADLESRVHGLAWDRWDGGQVYLGRWLIGAASRAKAGEHVGIVECDEVPAEFASWQHSLAEARLLPHLLVGYDTQLTPVKVELSALDRVFWTSERAVPFYGQMVHGGDAQLRTLFDPRLAYPPEFSHLQASWPSNQPLQMRLTTTLTPGRGDRLLTLSHDPGLAATLTFDGAPRSEVAPATPLGDSVVQRHLVRASERGAEIGIEAKIKLPAGAMVPIRVDLYEEPPCESGAVG
jgi:hypothetical protein